jgi:aspartyl-tRNA(Asn)/glutamyl-tRNA(Gln) amidotransferase subunit A
MLGTYTLQSGYYDAYYKKAQKVRTLIIEDFRKIFEKVDLLLAPTMPSTAPKVGITEGQSMYGELADILTEPSAMAGLPAISVPAGFIDKLPIGLQLIGPQASEDLLLDTAEVYEISTN